MEEKNLKKNGSGCPDPTAYKAIRNVEKDEERLKKLLDVIFAICDIADFHVEGRITFRDKRSGRIWR